MRFAILTFLALFLAAGDPPDVGLRVVARRADTLTVQVAWTVPPLASDQYPIDGFDVLLERDGTRVDSVLVLATVRSHDFTIVRQIGQEALGYVAGVRTVDSAGTRSEPGQSPVLTIPGLPAAAPSIPTVTVDTTLTFARADSFRLWPDPLVYDSTNWFVTSLYGQVFANEQLVVCRVYDVIEFEPPLFAREGYPCGPDGAEFVVGPTGADTTAAAALLDGLVLTVQ